MENTWENNGKHGKHRENIGKHGKHMGKPGKHEGTRFDIPKKMSKRNT
jgi:hypothetical protein